MYIPFLVFDCSYLFSNLGDMNKILAHMTDAQGFAVLRDPRQFCILFSYSSFHFIFHYPYVAPIYQIVVSILFSTLRWRKVSPAYQPAPLDPKLQARDSEPEASNPKLRPWYRIGVNKDQYPLRFM